MKKSVRDKLSVEEKYILFNSYKPRIYFAIKKAYDKFDSIPLELEDFEYYAWEAYLDILDKYYDRKMRKSFESCLIDAVYWKAMNICAKYVTNKYKIVNQCMRKSIYTDENYKSYIESTFTSENYYYDEIGWCQLFEQYFSQNKDKLQKQVFTLYLYGLSFVEIAEELKISAARARNNFYKVLPEIRQVVSKQAILD
ncbi:sigma-70 family RNA polymerase sigma factor [Mesoplasma chauliocola]|uniref:Sigma-70 family RNA polymerase sigma factor n=1 Tax=Mesoplasma chauliocola TaxID=216427 RepID=A0A249SMY2_9MOLU|nr:sigma-70 family RNA polymerase sigma factor [Mesoplasma chauliocola]ASZ09035.1 sigma-70 family RNA polymerase sigma factor [Mesoplasma chauliocola]